MRIRWHMWWLLVLASAACSLNPQPDLPAQPRAGNGAGGSDSGMGGTNSSTDTPGVGGLPSAAGGSIAVITPSDGGPPNAGGAAAEAGAGGEAGVAGAVGETPVVR